MRLLIVNLLPKGDLTARAAIETPGVCSIRDGYEELLSPFGERVR